MNARELGLRKELAITHMRIARGELALARAQKPDAMVATTSAIDLASALLARYSLGSWGKYLGIALRVTKLVLGFRKPNG